MIYLDYNATTPCAPEVVAAMLPYFSDKYGNASSKNHAFGWAADAAVERARARVAELIGATPQEIIFTSGATEACNLAIRGVFARYRSKGRHIITCATEHPAVLDTCAYLEREGASVTYLPVDGAGRINMADLESAIRPDTILIALMSGNNETGVLQPIAEVGAVAKEKKVLFFSDGTQAAGKIELRVDKNQIDLLALSAHKMYGPKGVGALYVRRKKPRVALNPIRFGGGQERGLRSGTLNVPAIVGFGEACAMAASTYEAERRRLQALRDSFEAFLLRHAAPARINGGAAERLPHVTNLALKDVSGAGLVRRLDQYAFSLGAACSTAVEGPSHVLRAMNLSDEWIKGSVRVSLGRYTTADEIEQAKADFVSAIKALREQGAVSKN